MNQTLNPITLSLTGTSLIEASAGTGKTFNIAALFTRLVLLERLPLDSILVVTFTKAATAELKNRLRSRLNQALALLQGTLPAEQADPILQQLVKLAQQQENDHHILILRLQAAITEFDSAAIYTIHSFCQRVLSDYAFLCQVPFETETTTTDRALLNRFAEDFWRQHINHQSCLAKLVLQYKLTPQKLIEELGSYSSKTELLLRQPNHVDLEKAEQHLQHLWLQLCQQLPTIEITFWQIYPSLNGRNYKKETFETIFAELHQAVINNQPRFSFSKADKLACFAPDTLRTTCKKNHTLPEQDIATMTILAEFGQQLALLKQAETTILLQIQLDCFAYIRNQLAKHRCNSRERSFDDLLTDMGRALSEHNPHAQKLAKILADMWQIALIDECQDTDRLQYQIFKTVFADQNRPLLMVGDPKQAIYRFRGADIHAYLRAANDTPVEQRYTLDINYRSHQALVQSVNHLFQQKQNPFILTGIDYPSVTAKQLQSRLNPPQTAIRICWLHNHINTDPKNNKETIPNKDTLRQRAAECCANDIAELIQKGTKAQLTLDNRPIQAGDIAVLVHTHNEGRLIAQTLKKRGIISVSLGNQSIFRTTEAQIMAALLHFWLQPQQTHYLRFVLGSCFFNWTAEELNILNQNEQQISQWIQWAQNACEHWQQYGIFAALQWFASQAELETTALKLNQERTLTNFWQLAEILASAEQELSTATSLIQWLEHHIHHQPLSNNEDNLLRLESDDALVKIVTMHAAKGLEYPIVYCPFVWDGKNPLETSQNWYILHQNQTQELVAKDLLSEADKNELLLEALSEKLRLYYVAFTRAREQLIIYAAASNELPHNPFSWLLDDSSNQTLADNSLLWKKDQKISTLKKLWQNCLSKASAQCDFSWEEIQSQSMNSVNNIAIDKPHYQALTIPKRKFEYVYYTSFTALSRTSRQKSIFEPEEEQLAPALDRAEILSVDSDTLLKPETELLAFARGINAGLCLHAILEQTEFTQPACLKEANHIAAQLARFGFDPIHTDTMLAMCDAVRQCNLFDQTAIESMPANQRITEMNFMLHMHDFNLHQLQQWFAQPHIGLSTECIQAARELNFNILHSFINGAIDLFGSDQQGRVYIVDYKSNHLGNRLNDYQQQNMDHAIAKHHYYLQALIYSIAAARFLKNRNCLPEQIAVRYLFLRGLNSNNQNGIWQWDISCTDLAPWLD